VSGSEVLEREVKAGGGSAAYEVMGKVFLTPQPYRSGYSRRSKRARLPQR
jgi:hypothetical protein